MVSGLRDIRRILFFRRERGSNFYIMKSTFTLKTAIKKTELALIFLPAIIVLVMPEFALANSLQSNGQARLSFEISPKQNQELTEKISVGQLSYDDLINQETTKSEIYNSILAKNLEAYLLKNKSPLAIYSKEIVKLPQWQRALAISQVESGMGKHCADNNCSGIGVSPSHPSWRRYPTKLHWFEDMTKLLEKPIYKERYKTCATMKGVYVVPGSARWVNGCNKVSNDLLTMTANSKSQADEAILALAGKHVTAATTELALVK